MFVPNSFCYIKRKVAGSFDKYGQPLISLTPERIPYALIKGNTDLEDSTVRADSSATHGNVKEFHSTGRILVPVSVRPDWDEIIIMDNTNYVIKQVEEKFNVLGQLDHYQLDLTKAEDKFVNAPVTPAYTTNDILHTSMWKDKGKWFDGVGWKDNA